MALRFDAEEVFVSIKPDQNRECPKQDGQIIEGGAK
jgi:hypothetical protein